VTEVYHNLELGDLAQDWSDASLLSRTNDWSRVASIMGFRGDTLVNAAGVDARTITGSSTNVYVAVNQKTPNSYLTAGVAEFALDNPTVALSGSANARTSYLSLYLDATGRENVTLSFTARDLETGSDNAVQQIVVQYRIGDTGPWINAPGGYIADASVGGATKDTNVTVTLPSDAAGQSQLQIRIMTTDAVGFDEWIGIDDIRVTSQRDPDYRPAATGIYDIQGEGHSSGLVDRLVTTRGIVTAVDANGFFIQDPNGDGNNGTSDAIFVQSRYAVVAVGDAVEIMGVVREVVRGGGLTRTEIALEDVDVLSSGNALPAAVLIGEGGLLPPTEVIEDDAFGSFDISSDGLDFWESLEGMRVTLDAPQVVSNTNRYGETDVVLSHGVNSTGLSERGALVIGEGDYNPEMIQIDDRYVAQPNLSVGDRIASITGILNYSFNHYELLATEAATVTRDVTLTEEVTALSGDANHLTVATYSVDGLDPTDGARFGRLAHDIVSNLSSPDVIALQGIHDADGTGTGADLSGAATAQMLIDAIFAESGVRYTYVEIAPEVANTTDGALNGNTRVGYLYREDRVSLVEGSLVQLDDAVFDGTRRPLVATWEFNGQQVTTINVHFTTRFGSDPLWGDVQSPYAAGTVMRTQQIAAVRDYALSLTSDNPSVNLMIAGDWGGYLFEAAQEQLTNTGLFTNLASGLDAAERYSNIEDGNASLLDNIVVSNNLLANSSYDIVHINSEFDASVRSSDHDPQVARIFLGAAPTDLGISNASIYENLAAGAVVGTLSANDTLGDILTYALVDDAGGRFVVDAATGVVTAARSFDYEAGQSFTIAARVTDTAGLTSTVTLPISIDNVNEAPTLSLAFADVAFAEDSLVDFTLPVGSFADIDSPSLVYSATLADGSALPGWLSFDASTGRFTGTPPANFNGFVDVRVTATGGALSASDEFRLTITPVNDGPVATNDSGFNVIAGNALTLTSATLLANDSDADGNALSVSAVSGAVGGTVSINAQGQIIYLPSATFVGTGSFSYTVTDGTATATATVSIQVSAAVISTGWVYGTSGNDHMNGVYNAPNRIDALAGNDTINGGALNDELVGGLGNDEINAGAGNDILNGGQGNDTLVGDAGDDRLIGGTGNDKLYSGQGNDSIDGGDGNDTATGDDGDDTLIGAGGNDNLYGGAGNDNVDGGEGNDMMTGDAGMDTLTGGMGNDKLYGGNDNDVLSGGDGNDHVHGDDGNDMLSGGTGNDTIDGGAGIDTVDYSISTAALVINLAASSASSGSEHDILYNLENVIGGSGNDSITGNLFANVLNGGAGNDLLTGGGGRDTFAYNLGGGNDTITDFNIVEDRIQLGEGVSVRGSAVGDFNRDGVADLRLDLGNGGSITLSGISSLSGLNIDATASSSSLKAGLGAGGLDYVAADKALGFEVFI
jgi:predicted extracellular nuclease